MDLGLPDRVYLVTGGSRGLGFAAAQALIAKGARVVLSAPHEATASAAAARLTQNPAAAGTVTWVVADNADPATQSPGRACRDAEAPSHRWQHATDDEGVRELPASPDTEHTVMPPLRPRGCVHGLRQVNGPIRRCFPRAVTCTRGLGS
jgi:hypothetical protein